MSQDINFKKISRKDLIEKKEIVKSAIENKDFGIIDKNVDRKDVVNVYDKTFFNQVMLNFESKQGINSCFINDFSDRTDSDMTSSFNVQIDPLNTCLKLVTGSNYGEYYTKDIFSNERASYSTINRFYLIVDADTTRSSSIRYYIVTDKNDVFPIEPNNKNPLEILDDGRIPNSVKIKVVINQGAGTLVNIKGMALLYNDNLIDSQIDVFRPDFSIEGIETPEDMVTLFRDPRNGDSLFKVESSTERVMLNYKPNGDLESLDIYDINANRMSSKVDMIYEDYTDSSNVTEKVLTRIRTRNSFSGS